jgi:hypothetical protein
VEVFRGRLGQSIRQGFQQNTRVVIVRRFEPGYVLFDTDTRRNGKRPDVITDT